MHLAQFNISKELAPLDSPAMKDFVDSLARINSVADVTDGFVWRLHDDSGNATSIRAFEDQSIIFNLSVWLSIDTLWRFIYHTQHAAVLKRRRDWFAEMKEHNYVLWWVAAGHHPRLDEAKDRLYHLREHGETAHAFTFARRFGEDGRET